MTLPAWYFPTCPTGCRGPTCRGSRCVRAWRFSACTAARKGTTGPAPLCYSTRPARWSRSTRTPVMSTSMSSAAASPTTTAPTAPAAWSSIVPAPATPSTVLTAASFSSSGNDRWSSPTADLGWGASLALTFARAGDDATMLATRRHVGPLAVQRPFYPEGRGVCHVYILHPPGGIVGGDRLRVDVGVGAGAHALLTTPAATKVYRSAGARAQQRQHLHIAAGATLEWLPQETILFDGAHVDLGTRVDLAAGGRFLGIETLCFGLPARAEGFARGRCRQSLELWQDGRPLLCERGRFDGDAPVSAARWGLAGAPVLGTLLSAPAPAPPTSRRAVDDL